MADLKISQLTGATTPLAGTEVLPVVQSSTTKKVAVSDLTAGRAVSAASLALTGSPLPATSGGTGQSSAFTASGIPYASSTTALTTGTAFQFNGSGAFVTTAVPSLNLKETTSGTGHRLETSVTSAGVVKFNLNWDGGLGTRAFSFTQNSVESFKIDAYDNITVSLGNIVQGTAGKGVNFTANTPAAGMTSQLLNWYEEGTWTPTVTAASGTITATNQGSRYTRVGKLVTAYGYLNISSVSSPSGTLTIGGLPFTNGSQYAACLLTLFGGSFTQSVGGYVDSNTTNIIATNLNANTAAAGGNIMVSASYMVA